MQEPVTDHFPYGGQAVVEGVMMRGQREMAVAVRAPSGEIVLWSEEVKSSYVARELRPWPFMRGAVLLWDTMNLGVRALVFAAAVGMVPREAADRPGAGVARQPRGTIPFTGHALWMSAALSVMVAITLFFVLPLMIVSFLDHGIETAFVSNLVEGLIRLGILIAYIGAIGCLPEIRRVYAYHGAEHKAIHAWEAGVPLDVAHVRRFPLAHPRCGTGFLLIVMLLSLITFMFLGRPDFLPRIASRILLVPVMAGVAYELLKYGARAADKWLPRLLLAPGMALQRLTTREPDDSMLEVAIAALAHVLAADGRLPATDPRLSAARRVDSLVRPLYPPPMPGPVGSPGD